MSIREKRNGVFEGMVLTYAGRILGQLVGLVVSIVLARILMPDDYGVIAVVMIFLNIADVFITDGFGNSIIQKKVVSRIDYSTVMDFSVIFSILMYVGLFTASPAIASFFKMPILNIVIKVLALRLPLDAINSVQQAYVSRNMLFHLQLIASFAASIIAAIVGITMAMLGYGVWALVAQYMMNAVTMVVTTRLLIKQSFGYQFSFPVFKELFSYGWKLLVTQLIDRTFGQIRGMAIGKMFTKADLAFYQRGQDYPNLLMSSIDSSMTRVIFPVISRCQDDLAEVRRLVSKTVQLSSFVVIPFLVLFYAIADKLVLILLTEKWMPCVPFIRIFCIYYMCTPIKSAKYQAIKAIGRSDVSLWCEIIQKLIGLVILIYTIFILRTVEAIAYGNWAFAIVTVLLTAIICRLYIQLPYKQQLKDITHAFCIGVVMAVPLYMVTIFNITIYWELTIQCVVAAITFFGVAKLFKFHEYMQLRGTIMNFMQQINTKYKKQL